MRSFKEIQEHARAWLNMVEPMRTPALGLIHAKEAHTAGRGTAEGLPRYHSTAMDGLYYVQSLLACGLRIDEACRGLDSILRNQDIDTDSVTFGQFRWYVEDDCVPDGNGTFFTVQGLLVIWLFYRNLIGDELSARIEDACRLSLYRKFLAHCPRVGWTNAFIGDNVLAAILAETFGDEAALAIVRNHFEQFYRTNFEHGIVERLSPCYYGTTVPLAALAVGQVRDPRIRRIARELLDSLLLEFGFFEHRIPLPACRTYNGIGEAWNFLFLAWPLGLNPMSVSEMTRRGWLHGSSVSTWHCLASGNLGNRNLSSLAAPRILEGRFPKDGAVYSYYHRDFTLGCFTSYPETNGEIQDPYDMPAGFSGDGNNLGLLGHAFQQADGSWMGVPLRLEFGDKEEDFKRLRADAAIEYRYVAHQHENVQIWLAHLDGVNASLRSVGTSLRIPQFTGLAHDENGLPLEGEGGRLASGWVFLTTKQARFGILPLKRTVIGSSLPGFGQTVWCQLPSDPSTVRPYPGPWHPHAEASSIMPFAEPNRRFELFFPNFESLEPTLIRRRSIVAGAVIVAAGREVEPGRFMENCRSLEVSEKWSNDGFLQCRDDSECIHEVQVSNKECSMRLIYDNKLKRVAERSVNDVPSILPAGVSHVRSVSMPLSGGAEL